MTRPILLLACCLLAGCGPKPYKPYCEVLQRDGDFWARWHPTQSYSVTTIGWKAKADAEEFCRGILHPKGGDDPRIVETIQ